MIITKIPTKLPDIWKPSFILIILKFQTCTVKDARPDLKKALNGFYHNSAPETSVIFTFVFFGDVLAFTDNIKFYSIKFCAA